MSSFLSLVLFTLMIQAAAGVMIIYTTFSFISPSVRWRTLEQRVMWIVLALLISSLAISFLHLGSPLNGLNALSGLESSWLSKEILALMLVSAFTFFTLILVLVRAKEEYVFRLRILTVILFIALIYSMTRVYMIPARPLWNSWATPAGFILSALLSGTMIILLLQKPELLWQSKGFPVYVILLILGATGLSFHHYFQAPSIGIAAIIVRVVLSVVSIAVLITYSFTPTDKNKKPSLVVIMVITALLSELAGRLIFFNLFDFSV